MKRFKNSHTKVKAILSVFESGEKLTIKEIIERLEEKGYTIKQNHLRMFIYYNMLFKYLKKESVRGVSYYYPIGLQ